jgi:hypothetical protein
MDLTVDFELKMRIFSPKIGEICDHNIDILSNNFGKFEEAVAYECYHDANNDFKGWPKNYQNCPDSYPIYDQKITQKP